MNSSPETSPRTTCRPALKTDTYHQPLNQQQNNPFGSSFGSDMPATNTTSFSFFNLQSQTDQTTNVFSQQASQAFGATGSIACGQQPQFQYGDIVRVKIKDFSKVKFGQTDPTYMVKTVEARKPFAGIPPRNLSLGIGVQDATEDGMIVYLVWNDTESRFHHEHDLVLVERPGQERPSAPSHPFAHPVNTIAPESGSSFARPLQGSLFARPGGSPFAYEPENNTSQPEGGFSFGPPAGASNLPPPAGGLFGSRAASDTFKFAHPVGSLFAPPGALPPQSFGSSLFAPPERKPPASNEFKRFGEPQSPRNRW